MTLASESDRDRRAQLTHLAEAARRAPSKHNAQPWRFVVSASTLEVWPDPARVLPELDPHRRELLLACGAAVQTAHVLCRADGLDMHVRTLPDGTAGPVGRLTVRGLRLPDDHDAALAAAVASRATDRGPLDATRLPPSTPFQLQRAAAEQGAGLRLVTAEGEREAVARLLLEADHRIAARPGAAEEVRAWSRAAGATQRDGVASSATRGVDASYAARFVQRDFSLPGSVPLHARTGTDLPLLAVLVTDGDTAADWVAAGRAVAQVLLELTLAGGSASFLNQVVEDPLSRTRLQDVLDLHARPQLVLRAGVGAGVPPSARRAAHDVIVQVR